MNSVKERDHFVSQNIGLVHTCAHRFKGKGIDYDDLVAAGNMGLVKAVDNFDHDRGVKFSTYAVPVILGEIRRLFRDGGSVKVSRSLKELSLKITRERERYFSEFGEEPTIGELAKRLDVSQEQVVEAIGAATPPMSLTVQEDEGGGQIDLPVASMEEMLSNRISLSEAIHTLDKRDKSLILLRYFRSFTQAETAKHLGMSQVQVSRREKKILTLLREKLE